MSNIDLWQYLSASSYFFSAVLPSSDLLSEEDQEEFGLRPVNGTTPANIIPAEDFIAQSRCELFVSDYISEVLHSYSLYPRYSYM